MRKALLVSFIALLSVGCLEGPTGPMGPSGPAGPGAEIRIYTGTLLASARVSLHWDIEVDCDESATIDVYVRSNPETGNWMHPFWSFWNETDKSFVRIMEVNEWGGIVYPIENYEYRIEVTKARLEP